MRLGLVTEGLYWPNARAVTPSHAKVSYWLLISTDVGV